MAGHRDLNESDLIFLPTETTRSTSSTFRTALRTPSQNFEFIHLSHDAPFTDARAKQRVRSHAMRDFRRRKGLPDMFEEQEMVQFSSPETTIASPASIEVQHEESDPIGKDSRRTTSKDQARGSSKFSNGAASQADGVQEIPYSKKIENSEAIGIVDQQATSLTSRPKSIARELPDIDKKNTPPPQNSPTSFLDVDDDVIPQDLSKKSLENQTRMHSKVLTLVRVPSAASFDPFNATPITSTERVRVLVHYYHSLFVGTKTAMNPRHCWFNLAITDPAIFSGTLLHCAGHYAMFYEVPDLSECFFLLGETTRLVNSNLRNPEKAIGDVNIAAVTALAFFENILGNVPASTVHIDGLKRMIDLRGGLQALGFGGFGGFLQRLVSWCDLWNAILNVSMPRFPHIEIATPAFSLNHHSIESPLSGPVPASDYSRSSVVSMPEGDEGDNSQIFQGLQQLSWVSVLADAAQMDAILYTESLYVYERRLLYSLLASYQSNTRPFADFVLRSYIWAAFIYSYSTLRQYHLPALFYGTFIERLRGTLNHTEFLRKWSHTNPILLLWVLVVGAVAAKGRSQRAWLVSQLKPVCVILKISSAEQIRWYLEQFVWAGGALGHGLNALWAELEVELLSG